jgi:kynurenine formamidase
LVHDLRHERARDEEGEGRRERAAFASRQLAAALASRRIRVVDLTQTLSPRFPADRAAARDGPVLAVPDRGGLGVRRARPGWYWNNFSCGEHTGTHFDAPIHWISGKDLPNNSVDTIPAQHFVAPACVIDCSEQARPTPTT